MRRGMPNRGGFAATRVFEGSAPLEDSGRGETGHFFDASLSNFSHQAPNLPGSTGLGFNLPGGPGSGLSPSTAPLPEPDGPPAGGFFFGRNLRSATPQSVLQMK